MKKAIFLIGAALLALAHVSDASTLAGVVVGSMARSDSYDVLVCKAYGFECYECGYSSPPGSGSVCKPEVFAGRAGYQIIHKKSTYISDGKTFIVMEVSKKGSSK